MKKKKRNPQDATLRNIRALKARVKELEMRVDLIVALMAQKELDKSKSKNP